MKMTPRQIMGWHYFVKRHRARRRVEALATVALGSRGDGRKFKEAIAAARKEGE